mgnify:CR=1 FL=1
MTKVIVFSAKIVNFAEFFVRFLLETIRWIRFFFEFGKFGNVFEVNLEYRLHSL